MLHPAKGSGLGRVFTTWQLEENGNLYELASDAQKKKFLKFAPEPSKTRTSRRQIDDPHTFLQLSGVGHRPLQGPSLSPIRQKPPAPLNSCQQHVHSDSARVPQESKCLSPRRSRIRSFAQETSASLTLERAPPLEEHANGLKTLSCESKEVQAGKETREGKETHSPSYCSADDGSRLFPGTDFASPSRACPLPSGLGVLKSFAERSIEKASINTHINAQTPP